MRFMEFLTMIGSALMERGENNDRVYALVRKLSNKNLHFTALWKGIVVAGLPVFV